MFKASSTEVSRAGTPRCGVPGRVQRPELLQTTMIKGARCAATARRRTAQARCPYLAAFVCLLAITIAFTAASQIPAFPGALGFAANASGGRNGTVYHVTTLANSGPGSFRDAASQANRIIVFDVSGYITITSELALNDNLTIAGQTAPGGGIGITGNEVSCGSSTNIIIRHMRFR